jgi:hypothetical protein
MVHSTVPVEYNIWLPVSMVHCMVPVGYNSLILVNMKYWLDILCVCGIDQLLQKYSTLNINTDSN